MAALKQKCLLSFTDCQRLKACKLDENTYLEPLDATTYAVRFYYTNIVLIHADGRYTLNNGGYQTPTTKERLNRFSPVTIYQEKRQWYLNDGTPFENGMVVNG